MVKSGNPKRIKTVWDLGRPDVAVVTPNPDLEQSTLISYAQNIFNIAAHDPHPPKGIDAEKLNNGHADQVFRNIENLLDDLGENNAEVELVANGGNVNTLLNKEMSL